MSRHRDVVLCHIHALGLRMNTKKSALSLSQRTVFLGVHLDSIQMQTPLAPARISSLNTCLARFKLDHHVSVSTCHRLLGLMAAASPLMNENFRSPLHRTIHSPSKGVAQLLSHPFIFSPEWSQNGRDSLSPNGHDGRIPDRLGCSLRGQTGVRSLD